MTVETDAIRVALLGCLLVSLCRCQSNQNSLRQALGLGDNSPDFIPDDQNQHCGGLSQAECDLQATAHNLYGFNLPYLSDAPASFPKYPSETWREPDCNIKKCPHTGLRDPLTGLENLTNELWTSECQSALVAVNCTAAWSTRCLPEYFAERRDFMVATQRYYNAICTTPGNYDRQIALGQCFRAIVQASAGAAFKSCSDTLMASLQKAGVARGPNPATRWTSGTVMKDHCCQIKQRQSCLNQGNVIQVCGTQSGQSIQTLFEEAYTAFNCANYLSQCV